MSARQIAGLTCVALLSGVLAAGCGGEDEQPEPNANRPAGSGDAYRATVAEVSEALHGGPSLSEARSDADIRELAEYHVTAYRSSARKLRGTDPPASVRAGHDALAAQLEADGEKIAQRLRSGAGKSQLYEAVTASRRDVLTLSDDLTALAGGL
jgi:hypothetical protein